MPKVYCYLNQNTADQLEQIRSDEGYESSSQVMKEMINLGVKVYLQNKNNITNESEKNRFDKEDELRKQHTTYLLRILSLNADILRCVYDKNKIPDGLDSIEDQIAQLKQKVDNYIDGYINN